MQICEHALEINVQPFLQLLADVHHDVTIDLVEHPLGVVAENRGSVGLGEALPEHGRRGVVTQVVEAERGNPGTLAKPSKTARNGVGWHE